MRTKHVHRLGLPQLGQVKIKLHNLPPFALHQGGLEVVLVHTGDLDPAYEDLPAYINHISAMENEDNISMKSGDFNNLPISVFMHILR